MTVADPSRIFETLDRHGVDYPTSGTWAGIDPTDPRVLANGASFTMDTDAGPLDFLNDVPGADNCDAMRTRGRQ